MLGQRLSPLPRPARRPLGLPLRGEPPPPRRPLPRTGWCCPPRLASNPRTLHKKTERSAKELSLLDTFLLAQIPGAWELSGRDPAKWTGPEIGGWSAIFGILPSAPMSRNEVAAAAVQVPKWVAETARLWSWVASNDAKQAELSEVSNTKLIKRQMH